MPEGVVRVRVTEGVTASLDEAVVTLDFTFGVTCFDENARGADEDEEEDWSLDDEEEVEVESSSDSDDSDDDEEELDEVEELEELVEDESLEVLSVLFRFLSAKAPLATCALARWSPGTLTAGDRSISSPLGVRVGMQACLQSNGAERDGWSGFRTTNCILIDAQV